MANIQATPAKIEDLQVYEGKIVTLQGWLLNKRMGKGIAFLILRDGSGFCQCVAAEKDLGEGAFAIAQALTLESAFTVQGEVVQDERQIGGFEVQVQKITLISQAEEYPIQKKEHGVDFLLDKRHLWLRSKRQWAVMRVRNQVIWAIHRFFQERGFMQMDAPIFTGNACEGTTDLFETDFFETPAYLSQSGQLYGEAMAMAMGKIYTFGPTFRAEKSKTRRHLSEFWMIEPEMAFYNLEQTMGLIEDFLRHVILQVLDNCKQELEVLERDTSVLQKVAQPFTKLPYDEAVAILMGKQEVNGKTTLAMLTEDLAEVKKRKVDVEQAIEETTATLAQGGMKKGKVAHFEKKLQSLRAELKELEEKERNIPQWLESAKGFVYGSDFGGSDETVITRMFETPVMVYDWPKAIKAFYMKESESDASKVKGVDVLAPEGYGEIVGGGERETDVQKLIDSIEHHKLPMKEFEWYLDLRRYGAVQHAGFGLGLERLVSWICHLQHLREAIPFPRLMGRLFP